MIIFNGMKCIMKNTKSSFIILFVLAFLITACGKEANIRDKKIYYWRSHPDSPNADLQLDLVLKEYPSNLKTIYVENIILTFNNGWAPQEKYLNDLFDFQAGNPKRYAFHLNGYTTQYLSQGVPTTAVFGYFKEGIFLNVDEWIRQDSCPLKKIQLQGLSADVKVELPDTLDIPFPCKLEYIKKCRVYDPWIGGCREWEVP